MAKISDLPLIDASWTYQGQLYLPVDLDSSSNRTTDQISAESLIEGYLANPTASDTHVINQETVYYCISNYLSEQFPTYPDAQGVNQYLEDYFADSHELPHSGLNAYLGEFLSAYLPNYLSVYLSESLPQSIAQYLDDNLPELLSPYLSDVVRTDEAGGIAGTTFLTLSYMNSYYDEEYDPAHESYYQANNEFTTAWQLRMNTYISYNSYDIYLAISQYLN